MQTNTKVSKPYRDKFREACFKEAYGLSSEIEITNINDNEWNWVQVVAKFKTKNCTYGLVEFFKEGMDNSTDYVVLEKNGKEVERFDRYIDAELALVKLMENE